MIYCICYLYGCRCSTYERGCTIRCRKQPGTTKKVKYIFVGHVLCGIRRGSTYGLPVFGLHHANRRLHLHHHFLITLR